MQSLVDAAELVMDLADVSALIRACDDVAGLRKAHEILLAARERLDDSITRVAIRLHYVRCNDAVENGRRLTLIR
jgi:hypothetical protein